MERIKDRYTITGQLGEGGMGVVFAAHDEDLDRMVAIKMLSSELCSNPEAVRIFEDEAKIMARIRHANIVSVHDVLRDGGRSCLVMEYIEGSTVEQIIRHNGPRIGLDKALDITLQLLAGLAYLHGQGIIHRDIKPSNLMVDTEGSVRLMDFGLARSLRTIAQKGTRVRGTPAYMAPEQIKGETLSCASDLYAVGVTLFELLTGRLPFQGDDLAYHHVHTPAPDVRTLRPDVPVVVALLIGTCLQKDPGSRPPTARSMMLDLVEGAGVHSRSWPSSVISALDLSPLRSSGAFGRLEHQSGPLPSPRSDIQVSQIRGLAPPSASIPNTTPPPQIEPQRINWIVAVAAIMTAIILTAGGLGAALIIQGTPSSTAAPAIAAPPTAATITAEPRRAPKPTEAPPTETIKSPEATPEAARDTPEVILDEVTEAPGEIPQAAPAPQQQQTARQRQIQRNALAAQRSRAKKEQEAIDSAPEAPLKPQDPSEEIPQEPAPPAEIVQTPEPPQDQDPIEAQDPPVVEAKVEKTRAPTPEPLTKTPETRGAAAELPMGLGGAGQKKKDARKKSDKDKDKDKDAPASDKPSKRRPYGF